MSAVVPCSFCLSAYVDADLTPDCDASYCSVGECAPGYRFMLCAGAGKAVRIEVDVLGADGWHTVGHYFPRFCPSCGRELKEFFVPKRGDCFCKHESLIPPREVQK